MKSKKGGFADKDLKDLTIENFTRDFKPNVMADSSKFKKGSELAEALIFFSNPDDKNLHYDSFLNTFFNTHINFNNRLLTFAEKEEIKKAYNEHYHKIASEYILTFNEFKDKYQDIFKKNYKYVITDPFDVNDPSYTGSIYKRNDQILEDERTKYGLKVRLIKTLFYEGRPDGLLFRIIRIFNEQYELVYAFFILEEYLEEREKGSASKKPRTFIRINEQEDTFKTLRDKGDTYEQVKSAGKRVRTHIISRKRHSKRTVRRYRKS